MTEVITHIEQVTPQWLTDALLVVGALVRGQVIEITTQPVGGYTAHESAYLGVNYSEGAIGTLPECLFLKLLDGLTSEAKFYRYVAPQSAGIGLVPCYAAAYDDDRHCAHVLLADFSTTHSSPPAEPPYEQLIDILADFHAHWWEHSELCGYIARVAWDPRDDVLTRARKGFPAFVDALGDGLTAQQRTLYERVLAALPLPAWSERVATCKQVTLTHGDTHPYNFLYPHQSGDGIYVIDWAIWHIDSGVSDIAYMVAMTHRSEEWAYIEKLLVERYHKRIIEHGIMGYDLEQCWQDYRSAIIATLPYTVFWQQGGTPSNIWRGNMLSLLAAYGDLNCEELLN